MSHAPHLLAQRLGLIVALAFFMAFSLPARAQPLGDVVVLPIGTPQLEPSIAAASMLEARLLDEHVSLVSLHDARDRFTARSRPAQLASHSDVDVLAREAREAIEHVAFGRTAAAQKSVREVIARAERTLESLNRETATARQILDTCLTLVRSILQSGRREQALEQAMRCRRLVPDLAPSEVAHPANVVGVLAEADNLLRRMRTGRLHVRSTPQNQCSVYLNGRHLGTTPFQLERAAAGEYRVQVECGRSVGRVHVVQLGDQPVNLLVDTEFDRAIVSEPRLMFRYDRLAVARERAVAHAAQLGREVGVDDALVVAAVGDHVELLRVHVQQARLVARARVPWNERRGYAEPALERALVAIAEARMEGETAFDAAPQSEAAPAEGSSPAPEVPLATASNPTAEPAQAALESEPKAAEPPTTEREAIGAEASDRRRRRAGYALLGAGGALVVAGLVLEAKAQSYRDELAQVSIESGVLLGDEELGAAFQRLQSKWERTAGWRWISLGGAGLTTLGSILLVRPRAAVPWWSYGLGGVGLGLVAVGIHQFAIDDHCKSREAEAGTHACRRSYDSAHRGALFATLATAFLAVPIAHLVRKRELSVGVQAGAASLALELSLRL